MAFQKSSGSPREKWVKAILPAAIILVVYLVFMYLPNSRKLVVLREKFENAEKRMVTEDQLFQLNSDVNAAKGELRKIQLGIDSIEEEVMTGLKPFAEGSANRRMDQIDRLCQELSINKIAQQSIGQPKSSRERGSSLREVNKLIPNALSYQKLELVGDYVNMVRFMDELPKQVSGVIPIGIEMVHPDTLDGKLVEPSQRMWRVYLMM